MHSAQRSLGRLAPQSVSRAAAWIRHVTSRHPNEQSVPPTAAVATPEISEDSAAAAAAAAAVAFLGGAAAPPAKAAAAARAAAPTTKAAAAATGSLPAVEIRSARATDSGMQVTWSDGERSTFHREWLFRNRLENLFHSGQNLMDPTERCHATVTSVTQVGARDGGGSLIVHWADDPNLQSSTFPALYLRQLSHSLGSRAVEEAARKPKPLMSSDEIPTVEHASLQSEGGVKAWLELVNRHGLCLVKNVPREEGAVSRVAERIGPVMNTIYGKQFDVVAVADPINVAYSTLGLVMHQDLVYYESPPGLQLLHCMRFDQDIMGGESSLADAFHAAEILRERDPKAFATLSRVPATFQKIHYDRPDPVHLQYRRPHIQVNDSGAVISVFWAPQFEGPLHAPEEDVEEYFRAYHLLADIFDEHSSHQVIIKRRLEPGDLLCFNNRRMVHGRTPFSQEGGGTVTSGGRHLQGCYVGMETYINRLRVLQHLEIAPEHRSPGIPISRVSNGDHA